ncbi:hypothetical protein HanPI659440_Chr09g0315571 [Helianthus annuus]|nr:hypothetical protein HanPI659440_Chr09g0315571 [Helianthus annuus]
MGVGTQTQKMMDYCNTPVQLSPSVIYDTAHEQDREASKINKKNLLKKMKANVKKYIKMVQDVQGMNNLVSEAKTKCFWDSEIMEACKQWDETLRIIPFVCRLIRFKSMKLHPRMFINSLKKNLLKFIKLLQMKKVDRMKKLNN